VNFRLSRESKYFLLIRTCINEPHSHLAFFEVNFCVVSWRMRELGEAMVRKRAEERGKKNERALFTRCFV
jgi:hypothetical protein